ncbi:hypothetical protein [Peptostreptococcus equinus]|uniref:Bacteriophage HK97-gp10, tail-component n=1 Tax=Peptostreptococcus equinus TaxID=3003601 RepID=A0ABY7JTP5_9FIRM|nr:hypothetical protein [Peptostreptococcus sp. CBA3647]WAW15287.1 hypothetical protein O0R46_02210 [Peptostreptococcus sp. CBA3647]
MEWEGLDDWIKEFERAEKKSKVVMNDVALAVGEFVLEDVIENTPKNKDENAVGAGTLQNAWKLRNPKSGITEVYNDAQSGDGEFYAWDVEYGHRTRAGMNLKKSHKRKRRIEKEGKILFVPGVFMLRDSMKLGEDKMDKELEKAWDKLFGGR